LVSDLVPRNTSGIASASAGDVGSSTFPFKDVHITGDIHLNSGKFVPTGSVLQVIFSAAPQGWLLANGSTIGNVGSGATHESADYEDLFVLCVNYFGNAGTELWANGDTVMLPDLRGYFVRGWDNSRGIDSGRAINTTQTDENKSHNHGGGDHTHNHWGSIPMGGISHSIINSSSSSSSSQQSGLIVSSGTIISTEGSESRPKNIALNYIIKV